MKISNRKPLGWQPLKIGDVVDVVAPGFGISNESLEQAKKFLVDLGLKPRVPADIFGPDVLCAQADSVRLRHLKAALVAKDSKAVWCLRGGYGAIRLVEPLSKLKAPALSKIFVGYSDSTTIHNFLNQYWGWATLHGPLLDRLGQHTLPLDQVNEALDVVFGRVENVVHSGLMPLNAKARAKRTLRGRVFGGNLTVTQSHLGTAFQVTPKEAVLVFEDIGERGYRVDRILVQLEQAGYFASTRAVVFGEFVGGEEKDGSESISAVIQRFADNAGFAVFRGLKAGHGQSQRMVPFNTICELRCGDIGELKIASGAQASTTGAKPKARRKK